uniref:HMG box domain-containing protein n=1 Tax=Panagrellus redivivus TaxID=6233 RepID=A0A7E4VTQ1_PANRE
MSSRESSVEIEEANSSKKGSGKERLKRIRDVNAPRRPTTSFNFFMKHMSGEYIKQNPTKVLGEVIKVMSKDWKDMSEDAKKPYNEAARAAREDYVRLLEEYQNSDNYREYLQLKSDIRSGRVNSAAIPKAAKHPRRHPSISAPGGVGSTRMTKKEAKAQKLGFEIFTEEFKKYNARRDNEYKALRRSVAKQEEELEDLEERNQKLAEKRVKLRAEQSEANFQLDRAEKTMARYKAVLLRHLPARVQSLLGINGDSNFENIISALQEGKANPDTNALLKKHIAGIDFSA